MPPWVMILVFLFLALYQSCKIAPTAVKVSPMHQGVMFVKLGRDTTFIQQFRIERDSIFSTIIARPRGTTVTRARGALFPNGNLKGMTSIVYRLSSNEGLQPYQHNRAYTTRDSTFFELTFNRDTTKRAYAGHCLVTNEMDASTFFMFPFWGYYAPRKINDSIISTHIGLGSARKYILKRAKSNELIAGSTLMGFLKLFVDNQNNLVGIDAVGSSLNFNASVEANINIDSVIEAEILGQRRRGAMAGNVVRDTVIAKLEGATVEVNYWRPSMRGRKIFGSVVPYNRFWRTGANHATQVRLTEPIYFNNVKLDSGRYSMFTLPGEHSWTLMFNSKADVWGTDYDPAFDVIRVPMQVNALTEPVEQLIIKIIPNPRGGAFIIEWENVQTVAEFTLQPS